MDTDALVHQNISRYSAEYKRMRSQLFMYYILRQRSVGDKEGTQWDGQFDIIGLVSNDYP